MTIIIGLLQCAIVFCIVQRVAFAFPLSNFGNYIQTSKALNLRVKANQTSRLPAPPTSKQLTQLASRLLFFELPALIIA